MKTIRESTDYLPQSLQSNEHFGALYKSLLEIYTAGFLPIDAYLLSTLNKLNRQQVLALARDICMPVLNEAWNTEFIRARIREHYSRLIDPKTPYGLEKYMKSIGYHVAYILTADESTWPDVSLSVEQWAREAINGYPTGFVMVLDERTIDEADVAFIQQQLVNYLPIERLRGIYTGLSQYTIPNIFPVEPLEIHALNTVGEVMAWTYLNTPPFRLIDDSTNFNTLKTNFSWLIQRIVENTAYWSCEFGANNEYCGYIQPSGIFYNYLFNSRHNTGFFILYVNPFNSTLLDLHAALTTAHCLNWAQNMDSDWEHDAYGGFYIFPILDARATLGIERFMSIQVLSVLITELPMRCAGLTGRGNYLTLPPVINWGSADVATDSNTFLNIFNRTLDESIQKWGLDVCDDCIVLRIKSQIGSNVYSTHAFYIGSRGDDDSGEGLVMLFGLESGYNETQNGVNATIAMHGYEAVPLIQQAVASGKNYAFPYHQAIATFKQSETSAAVYAQYLFGNTSELRRPNDGTRRLRIRYPLDFDYWAYHTFESPISWLANVMPTMPITTDIQHKTEDFEQYGGWILPEYIREWYKTIPTYLISVCPVDPGSGGEPQLFKDFSLGTAQSGVTSSFKAIGGGLVIGQTR